MIELLKSNWGMDCFETLSTSYLHHQRSGLDGNFFYDCLRNYFYSCFSYFISVICLFLGSR